MSNEIRSKGKQIKAPRELIEAVKKGERLAPRTPKGFDTRSTHVRRFALALAGYACAAALLIGGAAFIPSLLSGEDAPVDQPIAAAPSQSTPDLTQSTAALPSEPVWASPSCTMSECEFYHWYDFTEESGEHRAGENFNFPEKYPADTVFVVSAYVQGQNSFLGALYKHPSETVIKHLTEYEGWESFTGSDGHTYFTLTKAQIEALDTDALLELLKKEELVGNTWYSDNTSKEESSVGGSLVIMFARKNENGDPEPWYWSERHLPLG